MFYTVEFLQLHFAVSVKTRLTCFDTVGWVAGRASGP